MEDILIYSKGVLKNVNKVTLSLYILNIKLIFVQYNI